MLKHLVVGNSIFSGSRYINIYIYIYRIINVRNEPGPWYTNVFATDLSVDLIRAVLVFPRLSIL